MIPDAYINTILDLMSTTKTPSWCTLTGNSMAPLLCHGDALLVHPGNRNIRIGDVVIFKSSRQQLAHRVVGITITRGQKRFLMKGDNSYYFDGHPVLPEQVLAKVLQVKGTYGILNLNTVSWRVINFTVAFYSNVEARRHKGASRFWRIVDRMFTLFNTYILLKKYRRSDLYRCFIMNSTGDPLTGIKGEKDNETEETHQERGNTGTQTGR